MKLFLIVCVLHLAISSTCLSLDVLIDDQMMSRTQACVGEKLTFICKIANSNQFIWTALPMLGAAAGTINTVLTNSLTRGIFNITAVAGTSNLTVIAFSGFNGTNITCSDINLMNGQSMIAEVFDHPSAPGLIAKGNSASFDSFILTVTPPNTSPECVLTYTLIVKQDGVLLGSITFEASLLESNRVSTMDIMDPLITCRYNYSFELIPENGLLSSGEQLGDPNLDDVSGSFGFSVVGNSVSSQALEVPSMCIIYYQYSINLNGSELRSGMVMPNSEEMGSFLLEDSETTLCEQTLLIIYPIVIFQNTALVNVTASGTTCETLTTTAKESSPTTTIIPRGSQRPDSVSFAVILGPVLGGVCLLIAVIIIIVILVVCRPSCRPQEKIEIREAFSLKGHAVESDGPDMYAEVKRGGDNSQDVLPTYQDPATITHQAAGPSGVVYTVPEKKSKKGSQKNVQSEELPMYSVVDKNATKQQEGGLVYADLDVQNPRSSCSKCPPPPPGVTQHDAMEPVLYSTVQK